MARPVIFDCDPGIDDAVALLVTLASPEDFKLLGITVVAGNVDVEQTQINARQICELAGRPEIKVFSGCSRPLKREPVSDGAHGKTGLDGATLPSPTMSLQKQHAVDFIIETLTSHPQPVTMFITGPCTNMATAIERDSTILNNIEQIVIMGGSSAAGNITPAAEFNFFADPHAADIVLSTGVKTTVMTLDITHQVLITPEKVKRLRALNNRVAGQVADMMVANMDYERKMYGLSGRAVHDACVPVYLLRPDLFTPRPAYFSVEAREGKCFGLSLISFYPKHLPAEPHVFVPDTVKADEVFEIIIERLDRYER